MNMRRGYLPRPLFASAARTNRRCSDNPPTNVRAPSDHLANLKTSLPSTSTTTSSLRDSALTDFVPAGI